MLQVDLVALEHSIGIFGAPIDINPVIDRVITLEGKNAVQLTFPFGWNRKKKSSNVLLRKPTSLVTISPDLIHPAAHHSTLVLFRTETKTETIEIDWSE